MRASCIWFYGILSACFSYLGDLFPTDPISVFDQRMIEAADRDQKQYNLYVVKDMYPLLPFGPLTTYVEHTICEVAGLENGLADTSGS